MSDTNRTYLKITVLVIFQVVLVILIGLTMPRSVSLLWHLVLQETILFIAMFAANHWLFKQQIYLKPQISILKILPLMWIFLLFSLTSLSNLATAKHPQVGLALGVGLAAAIYEEYFFRGIVFGKLLSTLNRANLTYRQIWPPIIVASGLFGLTHLVNLFSQALLPTLVQVIQVSLFAVLLSALYLRSGSLLLPMLTHFSLDFMATIASGSVNAATAVANPVASIAIMLLYLISALIFLRPSQFKHFKLVNRDPSLK